MNEKPVAPLVIAAIICPICVPSLLAPAFLGSMVGVVSGWFSELSPAPTTGLAILFAILAYGGVKRIKTNSAGKEEGNERTAVRRND